MRYYNFVLVATSKTLREKAKIDINRWANPVTQINDYLYKNLMNGISFFIYREDHNIYTSFSFDESLFCFTEAYGSISEMLTDVLGNIRCKSDPVEITMNEFIGNVIEGQRREFLVGNTNRIAEAAHLWLYPYFRNDPNELEYTFREKIIQMDGCENSLLCDRSLEEELINIKTHKALSDFQGNPVHYIISAHSTNAATDIAEILVRNLYQANRLKSRRVEMISDIKPSVYHKRNYLEEIIEDNEEGSVVFDLTERFGYDPTDYSMTAKYIENLIRQYRNKCLFIFTYNMDSPGFSYYLLPKLNKYVIPVSIKEGFGDRRAAVAYLKGLIRKSNLSKYSGQANEYMKLFPGNEFTQTDICEAFEQFESWCLNRNILNAYDHGVSDDFYTARDEDNEASGKKLQNLIGLDQVKRQIDSILAADIVEKERKKRAGRNYQSSAMHMIFGGNPGTAKTTVAKLFGKIAKEKNILKSGSFVEYGGMDLDGIGCVDKIRRAFQAAEGGVLFIDEAYSLRSDTAISVLIQEMENKRENVIVILAGYNSRMKKFIEINEGLKSRIPYWIDFPDYSADELTDIFKLMVSDRGFKVTDDALKEAHYIFDKVRNTDNFGNGRYVRNFMEQAIKNQSVRLLEQKGLVSNVKNKELFLITKKDIVSLNGGLSEERAKDTAQKELDDMIGLSSAKSVINKVIARHKLNKLCLEKGISKNNASMHMVFTGNPGTAKTTVARLFAKIMQDAGLLSTGNFIETGRADLVGDYVGATAKLVKRKFKEAQGGVLFIDEAYALCDGYDNGYGDEAINTLVQEMENHREDVIVIFAGYPEPMQDFLKRNPGMLSRIAFQIEFEDYSLDELCEITKLMLSKRHMNITESAMQKLRDNYATARNTEDFGNGRYVRKMLEEAEMNLAERVLTGGDTNLTDELLTTIDIEDVPAYKNTRGMKKPMGFLC